MKTKERKLITFLFILLFIIFSLSTIFIIDSILKVKKEVELYYSPNKFNHIKTFAFLIGTANEIDNSEVDWLEQRFDILVGSVGNRQYWDDNYPNQRICESRSMEFYWPNDLTFLEDWGNTNNRDWEASLLHFQEDVYLSAFSNYPNQGQFKGWNPDDDTGICGGIANDWINDRVGNDTCCITDSSGNTVCGQPSDALRTAVTGAEARVPSYPVNSPDYPMPDVTSQEWLDFSTYMYSICNGWVNLPLCKPVDCFWEDGISYLPSGSYPIGYRGISKTIKYFGNPTINPDGSINYNHPIIEDRIKGGTDLLESISNYAGFNVDGLANTGSNLGTPYKELLEQYHDGVYVEVWFGVGSRYGAPNEEKDPSYQSFYNKNVKEVIETTLNTNEKRYLQARFLKPKDTDKLKMLSLAAYYLVSNSNTYYSFNVHENSIYYPNRNSDDLNNWLWFDAISFEIGQPIVNSFGEDDFNANSNTDQYFILESGMDPSNSNDMYYVLAREFEKALILVKLRPDKDSLDGPSTITTHTLNGEYMKLNVDGSIGSEISSVSLENNDGVILIKKSPDPDTMNNTNNETNSTNNCVVDYKLDILDSYEITQGETKDIEGGINNTGTCDLINFNLEIVPPLGWTATSDTINLVNAKEYNPIIIRVTPPEDFLGNNTLEIRSTVYTQTIIKNVFVSVVEKRGIESLLYDIDFANTKQFIFWFSIFIVVFLLIIIYWIYKGKIGGDYYE